jgi:lipid-binding SYLF domain-containing protein
MANTARLTRQKALYFYGNSATLFFLSGGLGRGYGRTFMKSQLTAISVVLCAALFGGNALADMSAKEKDKARADIRKNSTATLNALYAAVPASRNVVAKSAGYATFSNFGMKILVAGSGSGKGMAVNKKSKKDTFMKMIEVQAGLGFGIKKFRVVWVFASEDSLNKFINSGWETGGQATAGAKAGGKGDAYQGAVAVADGVWVYQLTDKGVALELTAKGTKYYKDDDLN